MDSSLILVLVIAAVLIIVAATLGVFIGGRKSSKNRERPLQVRQGSRIENAPGEILVTQEPVHEELQDALEAADEAPLQEFPYALQRQFLSPAELSYFHNLRNGVGHHAIICTKVALKEVFRVNVEDQSRFRTHFNKIDRKHVDFLLCDPATMQPLLGIELDDKSHLRDDRRERDAFVDQVFAAARLPLLHMPVKRAYVGAELAAQLAPYLAVSPPSASQNVSPVVKPINIQPVPNINSTTAGTPNVPRCPRCGSEMVLRRTKTGVNEGSKFWGCSTYPKCRGMVAVNDSAS